MLLLISPPLFLICSSNVRTPTITLTQYSPTPDTVNVVDRADNDISDFFDTSDEDNLRALAAHLLFDNR